jgi:threonine aldolase
MSDDEQMERYRAAAKACETTVFWHAPRTPAEALRAVADDAEQLGLTEWDVYAERGPVAEVERQVAELLGKPAVAFFPSGVMAQQAALRVWTDRTHSKRVAIPDLSHLLKHEDDGPRRLHGFEFEFLTTGRETATAEGLRALGPGLGAALVELPLRDAGCLLPTWEELGELSAAARELGVPLHADGARIWESQPFYDRPLAEIAAQFDSVYVSFYKGLGAPAGAALAGPADVVDEVRQWRHRHGGTMFSSMPYAVAARAGLRERLGTFAELHRLAGERAATIGALEGVRVMPDPPHTNAFVIYADVAPDALREASIAFAETEQVWVLDWAAAASVPGWSKVEFVVEVEHVDWSADEAAALVCQVLDLARQG